MSDMEKAIREMIDKGISDDVILVTFKAIRKRLFGQSGATDDVQKVLDKIHKEQS